MPTNMQTISSHHLAADADLFRSVVILGGQGLLAQALAAALHQRGVCCSALSRAQCDITRLDQIKRMFRERRPTLLFNCAAYTAVDACEERADLANNINGDAVGALASLCKRCGTHLVHFSTDFVFDGQLDRPYRPDDAPNPISAYGYSKLLGETRIQQIAPPSWLVVRTAWLFGRGGSSFPSKIIDLARAGVPLKIVNDQFGSPTYVPDLAEAVLELIDLRARGIWHLANTGALTWFDFARAVLDECGIECRLSPVSTHEWLMIRPGQARRPMYSALDNTYYTRATGHRMRGWQDALKDYAADLIRCEAVEA